MKKLTSILLVLMMILCMSTTAFADDTPTTNISITGDADRTYYAYELLKLTTSLKCDHDAGVPHEAGCYNYAYTVNEKYRGILKNQAFADAEGVFWGKNGNPAKPAEEGEVTDAQILAYLSALKSDNDGGTLRPVADRIYSAIKAANIVKDEELKNGENTDNPVEQGYWLIADVTNLAGAEKANSLVMVNTKGQDTLTITPKTALPEFEKKVKDINDSAAGSNIDNEAWVDSADHDKGDTVPFKLTATVPANVSNYTAYKMVFHDSMENGLTLQPGTVKVYKYATKADADANLTGTLVFDAAVDTDYDNDDVEFTPAEGNHAFELTMKNVLNGTDSAVKGTAFVVYYEATLNENAVMGSAGNSNTAYLEFSNNPYTDGTGKTQNDTVKVFTYQLTINKIDGNNNQPLKGAGFTLYKKDVNGAYAPVGLEVKGENVTSFTWDRLDDGAYKLVETTVPAGYNKMEDVEFTISAEHELDAADPALTSLSSTLGNSTTDKANGLIAAPVTNYTGTILPSTGAKGTMMLIGGGSVFIVLAAVFMITRKKMSVYED